MKKWLCFILILLLCFSLICSCVSVADTGKDTAADTSADTAADTSADTAADTAADTGGAADGSDAVEDEIAELDEAEKEELYQRAQKAKANKEYQYAHALFSLLSRENYRDSKAQERELISRAYASPVIITSLSTVGGGENCSFPLGIEKADLDYNKAGILYIGEGGTPHFVCVGYKGQVIDVIPDTTLTGVISMQRSSKVFNGTQYYMPLFVICLKSDGTVGVLYNPIPPEGKEMLNSSIVMIEEIKTQKDVVQIAIRDEGNTFLYLHNDGTVSVQDSDSYAPNVEAKEYQDALYDRVDAWKDIVCINIDGYNIVGLKSDGTLLSEHVSRYEETDHYRVLKEQSVQIMIPYIYDLPGGYLCNYIVKGRINYCDPAEKYYFFEDGADIVDNKHVNIVHNIYGMITDIDGNIFSSATGEAEATVNGVSYICDGFIVHADGKVRAMSDETAKYEALFEAISVYID